MYFIDYKTPVPRVPGLKGSDSARAENLEVSGPYKPIGGQPLFGSGSGSLSSGNSVGGFVDGCFGPIMTGMAGGSGGNNPANCMTPPCLNDCIQTTHPAADPEDPKRPSYPPFVNYDNPKYIPFDPYDNPKQPRFTPYHGDDTAIIDDDGGGGGGNCQQSGGVL